MVTTITTSQTVCEVKKTHQSGIARAQKALLLGVDNKNFTLSGYDFAKKLFSLKIKGTDQTIEVPSWYFKPIKRLPEGSSALEITEEQYFVLPFENFEGKLATINTDSPDTFSVHCADGVVKVASLDASIYNIIKDLEFKLKVKDVNALIWSNKSQRCYNIATYILVVE